MTDPLPVNELFQTIQGEGFHAGTPAVFIRLQGCAVGCPWCDTKYTWDLREQDEVSAGEIMTKADGKQSWARIGVESLVRMVLKHRSRHVVITGGEPCAHDLGPLTAALIEAGCTAQIETSGTYPVRCNVRTWVTVSPKLNMPGGLTVRDDALARADEIKMPVGNPDDITALLGLLDHANGHMQRSVGRIYLQPLSRSRRATDLCVQNAMANGFKISLQLHALVDWR